MATFLDVGLLQHFTIIFPVLLVFALLYAILQKTKAISSSVGTNALISIVIAFMVLLSDTLTSIINFMIPWFALIIIFLVLMILLFQIFGAKELDIASAVKEKSLMWTLIGIGIVLLVAALGQVLGQSFTEMSSGTTSTSSTVVTLANGSTVTATTGVATSSFQTNIANTLFHPKVLGLIIIFAIAIFAVAFLTGSSS